MTDIDRIREFIMVQRRYASFFEWYKREKELKETGVVQALMESMAKDEKAVFRSLRAAKKDPPDCLAETEEGLLVGFEVRELVDQKAVESNERGDEVYRDWRISEVIEEIQKIIIEKDSKDYLGGPYEKIILVIPTAEPALTRRELKSVLYAHTFDQTRQVDEAYLLFSYDAATQKYPYIKLNVAAGQ